MNIILSGHGTSQFRVKLQHCVSYACVSYACACMCACVHTRACVRACASVCARAFVHAFVRFFSYQRTCPTKSVPVDHSAVPRQVWIDLLIDPSCVCTGIQRNSILPWASVSQKCNRFAYTHSAHMRARMHAHMSVHVYTHTHTRVCACAHTQTYAWLHAHARTSMHGLAHRKV